MKIALLAAMPEEVSVLVSALSNKQAQKICELDFYTGQIATHEVVIVRAGVGKVSSAVAVTLLCERFNPALLINMGSAGGIGDSVDIGDVVVSTQTAYCDVDATTFGYSYGQVPKMPAKFDADASALHLSEKLSAPEMEGKLVQGLMLSGDSFIDDLDKISHVKKHFPDAVAIDMESAAVSQACYQQGLPFVIVRAISDKADAKTHDAMLEMASQRSADASVALMKLLNRS